MIWPIARFIFWLLLAGKFLYDGVVSSDVFLIVGSLIILSNEVVVIIKKVKQKG